MEKHSENMTYSQKQFIGGALQTVFWLLILGLTTRFLPVTQLYVNYMSWPRKKQLVQVLPAAMYLCVRWIQKNPSQWCLRTNCQVKLKEKLLSNWKSADVIPKLFSRWSPQVGNLLINAWMIFNSRVIISLLINGLPLGVLNTTASTL